MRLFRELSVLRALRALPVRRRKAPRIYTVTVPAPLAHALPGAVGTSPERSGLRLPAQLPWG